MQTNRYLVLVRGFSESKVLESYRAESEDHLHFSAVAFDLSSWGKAIIVLYVEKLLMQLLQTRLEL